MTDGSHSRWQVHPGAGARLRARRRARGLGVGAAQDVLAARRRARHAAHAARARRALRLAQRLRRQLLHPLLALAARPLLEAAGAPPQPLQRASHVLLPARGTARRRHPRRLARQAPPPARRLAARRRARPRPAGARRGRRRRRALSRPRLENERDRRRRPSDGLRPREILPHETQKTISVS